MHVGFRVNGGSGLPEGGLAVVAALLGEAADVLVSDRTPLAASATGRPQWLYGGQLALSEDVDPASVCALRFDVLDDNDVSVGQVVADLDVLEEHNHTTTTVLLQAPNADSAPAAAALQASIEVVWDVPEDVLYNLAEEDEEWEEEEEYEEHFEEDADAGHLVLSCVKTDFMDASDRITVVRVGSRFLVVGTEEGCVHVLDFLGTPIVQYIDEQDSTRINDLGIDDGCNFVGACSLGGMVRVDSVFGDSMHLTYLKVFEQPIQCMALCPRYETTARFLIGGRVDKIVLVEHTSGWVTKGAWRPTVLYKNTGCIHSIKWHGDLVAWADDNGVKVFDIEKRQKIAQIARPTDLHTTLYKCIFTWSSEATLIVAWGNQLAFCDITPRPGGAGDGHPDRQGFVTKFLSEEYFITGIVPFDSKLFLLVYPDDVAKRPRGAKAPMPEFRVLEPVRSGGIKLVDMNEVRTPLGIEMAGYEDLLPADYHLASDDNENEPAVYLVSPTQIWSGRQGDLNDRVAYMLKNKRFDEVFSLVLSNAQERGYGVINEETRAALLEELSAAGCYKQAADLLPHVLGHDEAGRALWRTWVLKFYNGFDQAPPDAATPEDDPLPTKSGHLFIHLVDKIPDTANFNLGPDVYELVLKYLLWHADPWEGDTCYGPKGFYRRLCTWPAALFTPETREHIIYDAVRCRATLEIPAGLDPPASVGVSAVEEAPAETACEDAYTFVSAGLARLYDQAGERAKALEVHLTLGRSDVFDFIVKHQLYEEVVPHAVKLLWKNRELTLQLLKENYMKIPPAKVVEQLTPHPMYLCEYLHALTPFGGRIAPEFHRTLAELYARFHPQHLPKFARSISSRDGYIPSASPRAMSSMAHAKNQIHVRGPQLEDFLSLAEFDEICAARLNDSDLSAEDRRDIYRARARVLGKSGECRQALELLIEHVNSVKESVEFIVEHDEETLFETLVTACFKGGTEVVAELLDLLGDPADPVLPLAIEPRDVIGRIDDDMKILGMKGKVERIIRAKAIKSYLRDGCLQIMEKDICQQQAAGKRQRNRGMRVKLTGTEACCACDNSTRLRVLAPQGVVVLPCGHTFHELCYYAAMRGKAEHPPPLPDPRVLRIKRRCGGFDGMEELVAYHTIRGAGFDSYGGEQMAVKRRTCPYCHGK
eukprot:TRINITY_DN7368_c0_g5_i1.p1 TRINITY_DN7368_c0_g5~~TRINITY_DN7368_c0_g5_i1.p1  ORF type:complete len:1171 (+),score=481.31 TRINITY_DN7368_c0_g5_i1:41-3514(+)